MAQARTRRGGVERCGVFTAESAGIEPVVEYGDSVLGRWTNARWEPSPESPLWRIVQRVWYFDGTLAFARERVFPDGNAEIVVQLDEPHRDGGLSLPQPFPAICVNGLRTAANVVVAPARRCRVAGIRLRAAHLAYVLRMPAGELVDVTVDLQNVVGSAAVDLAQRCFDAAETAHASSGCRATAVVRAAVRWTTARAAGIEDGSLVARVANVILRTRGDVRIDALRADTGLTRPELARRFRRELGITPKRFARVIRFHHALRALGANVAPGAAAIDLGYFDQAHLHRDFEEFAGMTPGAFVAATRYAGSASIAEG
jgi:AraC-like DNA-binding protein